MVGKKKKIHRPAWIVDLVASRSTCPRLNVGAVLVKDRMIVSTGYNGSPRKTDQCDEVGCRVVNGHCVRTNHGEKMPFYKLLIMEFPPKEPLCMLNIFLANTV